MKKYLLLFIGLIVSLGSLEAKYKPWTMTYLKLTPFVSNLNLNINKPNKFNFALTEKSYSNMGADHAYEFENSSATCFGGEFNVGASLECSEHFGIMGEIGGVFGRVSGLINKLERSWGGSNLSKSDLNLLSTYVSFGVFYFQPSFRIFAQGGLSIGADVMGFPNLVNARGSIYKEQNQDWINSQIALCYRGAMGFDYMINETWLFSIQYVYMRSITTATVESRVDAAKLYMSNHAIGLSVGIAN